MVHHILCGQGDRCTYGGHLFAIGHGEGVFNNSGFGCKLHIRHDHFLGIFLDFRDCRVGLENRILGSRSKGAILILQIVYLQVGALELKTIAEQHVEFLGAGIHGIYLCTEHSLAFFHSGVVEEDSRAIASTTGPTRPSYDTVAFLELGSQGITVGLETQTGSLTHISLYYQRIGTLFRGAVQRQILF